MVMLNMFFETSNFVVVFLVLLGVATVKIDTE